MEELILYGGSGGSKSHTTCQRLVRDFFTISDLHFMVTRKTGPSLKATTWRMIRQILFDFNYIEGRDYHLNRSDKEIEAPNGNIMRFTPIDDPQKIKSASYNVVYVEEITEFTEEDIFFVKNTIRRPNKTAYRNKLIMTFNPVDINHWVWQKHVIKMNTAKTAIIHSTHWDNPFLPQAYRDQLETLAEQDENFYRIYCLGEPGVLEHVIYRNYCSALFPTTITDNDDLIYGLDFGFNNPSALIEICIRDGAPFIRERLYESKLTNSQMIDRANALGLNKDFPYYCDSAEPDRIEEWRQAGYNAIPADKSVKDGIDYVKRHRLNIDPGSINTLKEIPAYSYRKKGDQVLDEPVKFRDHAMDAIRYALYTHSKTSPVESIFLSGGFGHDTEQETRNTR
ncbi:MAG: PBSX family phage terminase large subunit [Methanoregula sp.]|nr:PBSX family phage terminase large subunit [Methanoregula sp.]